MSVDPRAALDRFVAALEAHFHAVTIRRGGEDPRVDEAYYVLADAFEVYDDALSETYGEATPFMAEEESEEFEDDEAGFDDFEENR